MSTLHLPDRAALRIAGADAKNFLQGIISNDIRKLTPQAMLYAALLTPQGKFLFDFFLIEQDAAILLDCEKSRAHDLLKRLSMYKLRAQVELSLLENMQVYASDTQGLRDPRHENMGFRSLSETPISTDASFEEYERKRLTLGIPDSRDFIPERSFLAEFGMEQLRGVDFNKGCYVGQEVTARSKFRGEIKKCLHQVRSLSGALPPLGAPITANGAEIGQMRTSLDGIGLAVLRIAETQAAACEGIPLMAGDKKLDARRPTWF